MKTIEEKAKAYDEIIEKANKMHHENCETCQTCIEELIPELRESDDERIRLVLIDYIKRQETDFGINRWRYDYTTKDLIAWLEKQGEQKPEWNEDDEAWLNDIISDSEQGAELDSQQIDWLKSIKDRVKQKVELTQLDKNILDAAIAFVEQNNHFNCWGGVDKHTVLSALQSLRPQNRWKPSEEMLEALYRSIPENTMEKSEDEILLDKLYQGLKYGRVLSKN